MTVDHSADDYSRDRLIELCERAKREGTRMRRHRQLAVGTACLALITAVVGVVTFGQIGSTSPEASLRPVAAGPYRDVSWRQVEYVGLNFANLAYPKSLGCGSHSSSMV